MYLGTFMYSWWKMGLTVDLFLVLHLLRNKYNQNGRAYHPKALFPWLVYIWQTFVTSGYFPQCGNGSLVQILASCLSPTDRRQMWHKSKESWMTLCLTSSALPLCSHDLFTFDKQRSDFLYGLSYNPAKVKVMGMRFPMTSVHE
jgi:hypothetical protein